MNEYKVLIKREDNFEADLNACIKEGWMIGGDLLYSRDEDNIEWYLTILLFRQIRETNERTENS